MAHQTGCKDLLANLSLYVDHEASASFCEEIERHLANCTDCRVVVDTLRRTVSLYHTLPPPPMPEHLRERLYHTLHLDEFLIDNQTAASSEEL